MPGYDNPRRPTSGRGQERGILPRPRKSDRELLENAFYDATLEEQAAILHTLTTLHRLKKRQRDNGERERGAPKEAGPDAGE